MRASLWLIVAAFAALAPAQEARVPGEIAGEWRGALAMPGAPPQSCVLYLEAAADVAADAVVGTLRMPDNDAFLEGAWTADGQLVLSAEFFPRPAEVVLKLDAGRLLGTASAEGRTVPIELARSGDLPAGAVERIEVFDAAAHRPVTCTRACLPELADLDDEIVAGMRARGIVGLSIAVAARGVVVGARGYGWADARRQVKATAATGYRWASISKPLTAVAALLLERDGKLDLDRDVRSYVPEFPDKGHAISSRQLLAHLGGICHYAEAKRTWRDYDVAHPFTDRILALDMFKDADLVAPPGSRYHYSTHGYALLGAVLERAASQRYHEFVRERIAEPLGMTSLRPDYPDEAIPERAHGYHRSGERIIRSPVESVAWKVPGGGWVSSVEDLARFGAALLADRLLTAAEREKMTAEQHTLDGRGTGYGLGIGVREVDGTTFLSHSGSQNGTSTMLLLDPARQLTVAVMSNSYGIDAGFDAQGVHERVRDADPFAGDAGYVWVWLRSGPAKDLPAERVREAMAGHFANMARLARQGHLVLAGPLGPPRVEPDHRGVFVLDTMLVEEARALAASDPAVGAGLLAIDAVHWEGPARLRRLPILDEALRKTLPADAGPGATARPYVVARCADADRAERALAPLRDEVVLFGRLDGGEALFVLAADDLDAARALLARCGPDAPEWILHPWFASRALLELGR
jgi:CubicO group peptidase (beta-lactamase class C family)